MAFSREIVGEIADVARGRGIEPAALLAVVEVESGGKVHTTVDGEERPLILYEYHVFHRYPALTPAQRAEAVRRRLAAPRWGAIPYPKTQAQRYALLRKATDLHEQAAYACCSWGVGQVLGENADWLGFETPRAMAERAMAGLDGQLDIMLRFIDKRGLMPMLARHDWRGFARLYNGPGQVDFYAGRMAEAYKRHRAVLGREAAESVAGALADAATGGPPALQTGMRGDEVARLQRMLRAQGYHLHVDGDFGPATLRQVMAFQREQGLEAEGIVGPATLARLEALEGRAVG
jgi:hypothetical protein